MTKLFRFLLVVLVTLALPVGARAAGGDASVRLINMTDGKEALTLKAGEVSVTAPKGSAGGYQAFAPGGEVATVGSSTTEMLLAAGHFYSVVASGAAAAPTLSFLEDPTSGSPARAMLIFYNLTDHEVLNLVTADGKNIVVQGVASGVNGARAIPAMSLRLGVAEVGHLMADVPSTAFEGGASYTIIAHGSGKEVTAVLVKGEPAQN